MLRTRMQIKFDMVELRRAHFPHPRKSNTCYCDNCKIRLATDMHETISRAKVVGAKSEIHDLIYQPELCGLLCQECHVFAHEIEVIIEIEKVNEKIYGREEILKVLESIPEAYRANCDYGKFVRVDYGG